MGYQMKYRMEAIREQLNLAGEICKKIKLIYFTELSWPECKVALPKKFNELKNKARKFYSDHNEKEMLIALGRYTHEDIKEIMETNL